MSRTRQKRGKPPQRNPAHRCDTCGRFVPLMDLLNGAAKRQMVTPDSAFTSETYETTCRTCRAATTYSRGETL